VGDQVVVSLDRQDVVAGARVEVIKVQTK